MTWHAVLQMPTLVDPDVDSDAAYGHELIRRRLKGEVEDEITNLAKVCDIYFGLRKKVKCTTERGGDEFQLTLYVPAKECSKLSDRFKECVHVWFMLLCMAYVRNPGACHIEFKPAEEALIPLAS